MRSLLLRALTLASLAAAGCVGRAGSGPEDAAVTMADAGPEALLCDLGYEAFSAETDGEGTLWVGRYPSACTEAPPGRADSPIPVWARAPDDYLHGNGLEAVEVGVLESPCPECSMPFPPHWIARVREADVEHARTLGFQPLDTPGRAFLWLEPHRCGNPWGGLGAPEDEPGLAWSYYQKDAAPAGRLWAGFAWPTTAATTCEACSCPRGDRLVLDVPVAAADGLVAREGFTRSLP